MNDKSLLGGNFNQKVYIVHILFKDKMEINQYQKSARDIRVGYEVRELFDEASVVPSGFQRPTCSFDRPSEMYDGHLVVGRHYDIARAVDGELVAVHHPRKED